MSGHRKMKQMCWASGWPSNGKSETVQTCLHHNIPDQAVSFNRRQSTRRGEVDFVLTSNARLINSLKEDGQCLTWCRTFIMNHLVTCVSLQFSFFKCTRMSLWIYRYTGRIQNLTWWWCAMKSRVDTKVMGIHPQDTLDNSTKCHFNSSSSCQEI